MLHSLIIIFAVDCKDQNRLSTHWNTGIQSVIKQTLFK